MTALVAQEVTSSYLSPLEDELTHNNDSAFFSGDTILFSVPSMDSLYIIDSFDEELRDSELGGGADANGGGSVKLQEHGHASGLFGLFRSGGGSKTVRAASPINRKEPAKRLLSCDTLLFSTVPQDINCDNFTDAGKAYENALTTIVSDLDLSAEVPDGDGTAQQTREVVMSRNSPKESYGMSLRATRDGRVLCTAVDCDSPADAVGIVPGDEVTCVNGFDVRGWPARYVAHCLVQGELACKVTIHHDSRMTQLLTLEYFGVSQHAVDVVVQSHSRMRQRRHMILHVDGPYGTSSTDVNRLGLAIRNGRISDVVSDSPAEAAGLTIGDVVVAVGTHDVVGYCDSEIYKKLYSIKGFFSITTMAEDDYRLKVNSMHISQAA